MRALILVVMLGAACVPKQFKEAQASTESRVTMMTTRQAVLEQSLEEATRKVDQLQAAIRARGQSDAQTLQNLEQVSDRMRSLQGQIEEIQFGLADLQRDFESYAQQEEARQLHDELRLEIIEKTLGLKRPPAPVMDPDAAPPGTSSTEPGPEATAEDALPDTAEGKLERAVEAMKVGRNGVARYLLQKTLEMHPGDPLIAEVRYRIGEAWANDLEWAKAASAFDQVVTHHPKSTWASWSMLRTGEAFLGLGQVEGARLFLEDTVRLYPKSEAAAEARDKLKDLK